MWRAGPLFLLLVGCADPPPTAVGVGGCAGRGCHGALEPVPSQSWATAATDWLKWDKHGRAFEALKSERSADMVAKLGWPAAATEPRCLSCHGPAEPRADGVGCEACHTAPGRSAGEWRDAHWQKADTGGAMRKLGTAADRAAACVGCHVGEPGREVTHDLIAAGHPRLTFDLLTYLELMPPHWPSMRDGEPKPEAWQAGQLAASRAALTLAADRIDGGRGPELADRNCFACHHGLHPGVDRPGWASPLVSAPLATVQGWGEAERQTLVRCDSSTALRQLCGRLAAKPLDADRLAKAVEPPVDWDSAAQGYYALKAAGRPVDGLAEKLRRPRDGSPLGFDLTAVRKFFPGGR